MPSATSERTVHLRTCPLCEAMCGLEIHVEGDQVALIRADRDDAWSKGHLCPKGTTLGHLHHDPDRLRAPMVRDGDSWREVSWDEAFRRCSELLAPVIAAARHRGRHRVRRQSARAQLQPRALRRHPHRHVRHPDDLLRRDRRPVAEERELAPHVRRHVEDPRPGHPADRSPRRHGREPAGVAGSLLACPDVMGEIDGDPRPRRQGHRRRPAPDRHRGGGRRVDGDHAGHRRRACCSRWRTSS